MTREAKGYSISLRTPATLKGLLYNQVASTGGLLGKLDHLGEWEREARSASGQRSLSAKSAQTAGGKLQLEETQQNTKLLCHPLS